MHPDPPRPAARNLDARQYPAPILRLVDGRPTLLLVEDDRRLAGMIREVLEFENYAVEIAGDGQQGLHLGLTNTYDVIILDRGLPIIDGLDLLGKLRAAGVLSPVLVLSALGLASQRVEGLDGGADDYIAKPFDINELLARLRALLRRHASTAPVLHFPGGVLDVDGRIVSLTNEEQHILSERESALLERLARRPTQVFSRDDLLMNVFAGASEPGVVDAYVHHLRRKLGRGIVQTVRGVGYRMGGVV